MVISSEVTTRANADELLQSSINEVKDDITQLQTDLQVKVDGDYVDDAIQSNNSDLNNYFVTKSTSQTINSPKVFTSVPQTTQNPVADDDITKKSYVDAQIGTVTGSIANIKEVPVPVSKGQTLVSNDSLSSE